jgi:hypothetical protein
MYKLNEKYQKFIDEVLNELKREEYEIEVHNNISNEYLVVFINGKSFHISESSNAILNQFYSKHSSLLIEPEIIKNKNSQYDMFINQYRSYEEQLEMTIDYMKNTDEINEPLNILIEKSEKI